MLGRPSNSLCRERGQDYASLSRLIGRNSAYIQQFIRRGTPRRLPEQERRVLARHFGVPEHLLGAERRPVIAAGLVPVPLLDLKVSAGPGTAGGTELPLAQIGFDPAWLNRLTSAGSEDLNLVQVEGDSMAPTLLPGDDILVDRSDGEARVRDGIYVLRIDDSLLVKRLTRASGVAAGHRAVGQSGVCRLARPYADRHQSHRPGDLDRAAGRLAGPRPQDRAAPRPLPPRRLRSSRRGSARPWRFRRPSRRQIRQKEASRPHKGRWIRHAA